MPDKILFDGSYVRYWFNKCQLFNAIRQMEGGVGIGGEIAPYATATEEQNRSSKGWIKRTIQSAFTCY